MKTFLPKVNEIERKWYIIDADKLVLGRAAVQIANILRGKNKATYTPHLDCGDYVVVINAEKVVMTGNKDTKKEYQNYSGYMGGLKRVMADVIREKNPTRLVTDAVWGMMPKGILGREQFRKLKVFAGSGPEHKFAAQNAETLVLK
ncbi:MAG: 50S ribosomal protein L13 [Lentisphaeria bacterium]